MLMMTLDFRMETLARLQNPQIISNTSVHQFPQVDKMHKTSIMHVSNEAFPSS